MTKQIEFTKDEIELIYYQLLTRKEHFADEMKHFAEKKDLKEVRRCFNAIDKIDKIMKKLLDN